MKGLPLVVMELGFGEARFEEQKRKGMQVALYSSVQCQWMGPSFWQKLKLKTEIYD